MDPTLGLIAGIVSRLPESGEQARALRRTIDKASADADGDESGPISRINAIVMAIIAGASSTDAPSDDAAEPEPTVSMQASTDGDEVAPESTQEFVSEAAPDAAPTEGQAPADAPEPGAAAEPATAPAPEPETAAPSAEPTKWTDREKLLYRDIIHLFELGDHSGAMASLERLYMLAPGAAELNVFLGRNESTLLKLYRDHIGSMDRVTLPSRGRKTIRIPTPDPELMLKIIRLSDGHRPIKEFVRKLEASELHILMVIAHLARSGYLELA